jgi:hypothetical protein
MHKGIKNFRNTTLHKQGVKKKFEALIARRVILNLIQDS